jgi:hypothetical protein
MSTHNKPKSALSVKPSVLPSAKRQSRPNGRHAPQAIRLLEQLAQPGATASASAFGKQGALDVFALRKGVSLRVAGSSADAAAALVDEELAHWTVQGASGRRCLTITPRGTAYIARSSSLQSETSHLAQHTVLKETLVEVNGVTASVSFNDTESPLAWLARRKGADGKPLINPVQLEAGERLRRDLELAQMLPSVTANWSGIGNAGSRGDTGQHISDMVIGARQRVGAALDAAGSDCAGVLIDVCGFLKGLGEIEFERQWPRRSAKVVLSIALSALAKHYGLAEKATGPTGGNGLRHWGSVDFRPVLSGSLAGHDG